VTLKPTSASSIPSTKKRPLSSYVIIGLIGVLAVIVGFSKTFFLPLSRGAFHAPLAVHIHGVLAFGWVIFYCLQTYFIHRRNIHTHRSMGWIGALLAVGVSLTMFPAGMFQVKRDLQLGLGDTAISAIVGVVTSGILFSSLVFIGFYFRRKPEVHKALMLVATVFVLWPAWFRFRHFFPPVPRPDIWFGLVLSNSILLVALTIDYLQRGRVNKTLVYVGAFIVLESTLEVIMFDSPWWRMLARTIYDHAV
jgi:hypothetical protein